MEFSALIKIYTILGKAKFIQIFLVVKKNRIVFVAVAIVIVAVFIIVIIIITIICFQASWALW